MKKIGGYALAIIGALLILCGAIGAIDTIYFVISSDASAYNIGFILGRITVLFFVAILGFSAFKKSKSFTSNNTEVEY